MIRRLAVSVMLLLATPAAAHRGHASLAVIVVDAKTGAVTVTHSLAAHDVEPALVAIAPDAQPSLDDPEALDALTAYVGRRFRLTGVPLGIRSRALAGDDVVMVFAGRIKRGARSLEISASLFGETHPDHMVQVNVRSSGVTRTVQFHPGDGPKTVPLGTR
ncbi:DUF6702 family protein [Sandarakinorhabdus sp.]|uniref:DUF6702 family protein n=1 Tax=Sandarakinorhabdus sp. TaxID=1916663 RepID=UPI00286DF73D|nr:DUF6702 family protein [Sandarakinorhabdus sp.]